jgi:hypothetical protein
MVHWNRLRNLPFAAGIGIQRPAHYKPGLESRNVAPTALSER